MAKFIIRQKRMITEQGIVEMDLPVGTNVVEHVQALQAAGNDPLAYARIDVAYLSLEVEPVPEPAPKGEPANNPSEEK